ncbi:MAG TPA: protein phosphatase 2C domain-containing protein [Ktedonobacteraceae bacterium]|nr:protein phosphatase 2C domain-containing protein [Ktedonobacteraceae bacterium]
MQAEGNILERVAHAYVAYRRVRLICVLAVVAAAPLLFLLGGGFPPWSWRLLFQVLPQISALLAARGQAALLSLIGLILLSVTLLLAWLALLWLYWRMLAYWWYERRELQNFAVDLEEAQYQAQEDQGYVPNPASVSGNQFEPVFAQRQGASRVSWSGRRLYSLGPVEQEEEQEEEEVFGSYETDESEEEEEWEEQDIPTMPVPVSPLTALQGSAPMNNSGLIEHPGAVARMENIQHSSYGLFMPSAPSAILPLSPLPRLNTIFYEPEAIPTAPLVSAMSSPVQQPPFQMVVSTGLDVGLKRKGKPNEDSLLALQNTRMLRGTPCPVGLFVIADGMGGHQNGQEASRLVIQSLSKTIVPSIIYGPTDDNYAELLAEGVHHANLAVYQRNREEKADMGTTIAAALVVNTTAYIANVGDSRAYLYRASSGLSQVTRDHSTVARLVENGLIQPEDVYTHPRRNEIYRSLGRHPSEDIDKFTLALQPEDILLLCSDGLWEMVRDREIQRVIEANLIQPMQIGAALVQAALDGGGQDNVSVVVVYIQPQEERAAAWAG